MAQADTQARLKVRYEQEIRPTLIQRFGYSTPMQAPRIKKITLNMGVGDAKQDTKALEAATEQLATIAGQKPNIRRARKSVAAFKLREGMPVGISVTLRGERSYEFLDRLMSIAIPRIRDFRGMNPKSFDGRGNYSLGVREQIIFPEIDYDSIDQTRGMDITITTSAQTDVEAFALLASFGFPFAAEGRPEVPALPGEEVEAAAVAVAEPEAAAEPEADAEPEAAAAAEIETEAVAEPEADAEPEAAAAAEIEVDAVAEIEVEPEPAAEAEAVAESEPDAEAVAEPDADAEPEAAAVAEIEAAAAAEPEADIEPEAGAATEIGVDAVAEGVAEPEAAVEPEPDAEPEPETVSANGAGAPQAREEDDELETETPATIEVGSIDELPEQGEAEVLDEQDYTGVEEASREPEHEPFESDPEDRVEPDAPQAALHSVVQEAGDLGPASGEPVADVERHPADVPSFDAPASATDPEE
jgi:large subunit ribosomal protein L5